MKLTKKLLPIASAAAIVTGGMVTPIAAQAETSASMAFSNMYLWRGQNLSQNGSVISGSLDYSNESGLHAGIWTTSETGGHETDITIGYGGSAGGVDYDVTYWWLLYPEDGGTGPGTGLSDTDAAELSVSLGYQGFLFEIYMQMDSDKEDDNYITLGYSTDMFGITYGMWDCENPDTCLDGAGEYTHLTFSYTPIDELSFTISKAMEDITDGIEEDPLFQVTYSKSFDLKK